MSANLATVAYLGAIILFILSLGGLSNPESSRRGNLYGMIGMTIAVLATVCGPQVTASGYVWILGAVLVGATIGTLRRAHRQDDADARARRADAQPRRSRGGTRRLRELHRSGGDGPLTGASSSRSTRSKSTSVS
jgi:hypothetical protein